MSTDVSTDVSTDFDTVFDIAICGAGPVGGVCALLLAEFWPDPQRIVLIDKRHTDEAVNDARMIAISDGSRTLLERVGAWDSARASAIHHIHVSQRGHFGRTLIDRRDYGLPALGYVIRYGDLAHQVNSALARQRFHSIRPATVMRVKQSTDHAELEIAEAEGQRNISAAYAIHAEGGLFGMQSNKQNNKQENKAITRAYDQTAITSFITCTLPQSHTAWERFTPHGPIALLPAMQDQRSGYALVWCCKPDDAAHYLTLDDADFLAALQAQFGNRLGRFASVGERSNYPLGLNAASSTANGREFAIGNAAQTLHPVAGQGLNLGLRDAFTLVTVLREHFAQPAQANAAFLARRRLDRRATISLTDWLPRLFASRLAPVIAARGTALALLDLLPPARHLLARQMMNGQR